MRISMLDPSLFTGRYDDGLCSALADLKHEVTLFGRPLRETDAIAPKGYRYVPRFFRLGERLGAVRAVKAAEYGLACLAEPIGDLAGNVVHMQWLPLASADRHLIRRLKGRSALVHTVHNAKAFHGDKGWQGRGYHDLLSHFDGIIVHTGNGFEALREQGMPADLIHIVPHPPMRLAQGGSPEASSAKGAARLLFFGTIRPYKGLDLLIEACLDLWKSGHAFDLAIAGKPFEPVDPLLNRVKAAGYGDRLILELGFLPEPRLDAQMAAADIIVFPYRHIDASGAFLSALHHGKAMVASDVGMFADHAQDIALFPSGDAGALAATLLPLIESAPKRLALGERARALGERMGSWKDAAVRTVEVYAEAIERAKARLA